MRVSTLSGVVMDFMVSLDTCAAAKWGSASRAQAATTAKGLISCFIVLVSMSLR